MTSPNGDWSDIHFLIHVSQCLDKHRWATFLLLRHLVSFLCCCYFRKSNCCSAVISFISSLHCSEYTEKLNMMTKKTPRRTMRVGGIITEQCWQTNTQEETLMTETTEHGAVRTGQLNLITHNNGSETLLSLLNLGQGWAESFVQSIQHKKHQNIFCFAPRLKA